MAELKVKSIKSRITALYSPPREFNGPPRPSDKRTRAHRRGSGATKQKQLSAFLLIKKEPGATQLFKYSLSPPAEPGPGPGFTAELTGKSACFLFLCSLVISNKRPTRNKLSL